jgi:2-oxoglutarate ferredoxin oxidoreductase subunit alpha
VVFAGSGGAGAMTAGELLLRAAADAGYYGMMSRLLGPQVRGGEAAALVSISTDPVTCHPDRFDLFVAFDWEKVDQFGPEIPLDENSVVLADPERGATPPSIAKSKVQTIPFSMGKANATPLERALHGKHTNVFAAGAVGGLAGLPSAPLHAALASVLDGKSAEVMRTNAAELEAGLAAAASLHLDLRLAPPRAAARWLITGNQAVAVGALRGGVRFVGCYPITPATDLVEWMAPQLQKLGGRLALAEDELAAINMVLGASYAGVPAMTVTSGPGLSLMVESIGLGIAAEIPAVIVARRTADRFRFPLRRDADLVSRLWRLWCALGPGARAGVAWAAPARGRPGLRHRLLLAPARLYHLLRVPRRAWSCIAVRRGRQNGVPRP